MKDYEHFGAIKMTQCLTVLASLPDDQDQFQAPVWEHTAIGNQSFRGCNVIFQPLWAPCQHLFHRSTCKQSTHQHKKLKTNLKNELWILSI